MLFIFVHLVNRKILMTGRVSMADIEKSVVENVTNIKVSELRGGIHNISYDGTYDRGAVTTKF